MCTFFIFKVQELVPLGSMLAYLIEFHDRISPSYELIVWASQIACGKKLKIKNKINSPNFTLTK